MVRLDWVQLPATSQLLVLYGGCSVTVSTVYANKRLLKDAPIVQWIEQLPSKQPVLVRFQVGVQRPRLWLGVEPNVDEVAAYQWCTTGHKWKWVRV